MGLGYKIKTFCVFTTSFLLFAAAAYAAPDNTKNNDVQTQLKEAADLYFSYKPKAQRLFFRQIIIRIARFSVPPAPKESCI